MTSVSKPNGVCHGSDGRGATGFPNLADNDWQWGGSFEQILVTLENGRQAAMPPFAPVLGEDGTKEVIAYVRQMAGLDADAQLASAGQMRFQTICMACHGMDGKGNKIFGAPNLTDDVWLYGGSDAAIRETIVDGRNGMMPAFGETLTEERRRLLAAYVQGLSDS